MASDFCIRQAVETDAPVIAGFVGSLLLELFDSRRDPVALEATAQRLLATPDSFTAFVAWQGKEPIGVLTLATCVSIYADGTFGEIAELCVSPEHRSVGVGEALIAAAADYGHKREWSRLEVGAPPADRWARTVAFYRRNGFSEIGPRLGLSLAHG